MNIALSTIFILVLILPGILFRFSYLKGPYSKQNFKPSTIDEIIWAIVPSIFFHMLGYMVIDLFTSHRVNFKLLFLLMSSSLEAIDNEVIHRNIYLFILYLSAILLFSFLFGLFIRRIVILLKLDYKSNFFRINNDWYYILTNSLYDKRRSETPNQGAATEFIQVDVLVKADKDYYLIYSGILSDFFLSKEDGLDKICLVEVYRRRFSDDLEEEVQEGGISMQQLGDRYYNMPGDLFVIPYSQILNLNISYYTFSPPLTIES